MRLSQAELTSIRNSPNKIDGAYASFVLINEKWGFKIFQDEYCRDTSYNNQEKCLAIGLAPELGQKFDEPCGYITEVIEPIVPHSEIRNFYRNSGNGISYNKYEGKLKQLGQKETEKRLQEEAGFAFYDNHIANWGTKNGVLMPLDFDS